MNPGHEYSRRCGFNFQWLLDFEPDKPMDEPNLRALDFLVKHGFDYVRLPTNYWFWTKDFDYDHPDETVFLKIDRAIEACRERGIHAALNCHRVPGYCINSPEIEKHNLWTDAIAQDALDNQWRRFAERYRDIPSSELSFDLINEPPHEGERGFNREIHQTIIRRLVATIRSVSPDRVIVANGLAGGHLAIPELADLGIVHSSRGYQPMTVSHYHASWWAQGMTLPYPVYPGGEWEGRVWNRETLREYFQPWRDVHAKGVPVHIGECGCYIKTPNDVALRWMADLFEMFVDFGWGFGLWNFEGTFGIVEHGRPGARYEMVDGYRIDVDLLAILKECSARLKA